MKNLKNNRWLAGITMIVLLLGVFFAVKAMENKEEKEENFVNKTWYFTGDSEANPEDKSNYSLSSTGLPTCGVLEEVICQIEAPEEAGLPKMDAPVEATTVQLQVRAAHQSILDNDPTPNTTVKEFRAE